MHPLPKATRSLQRRLSARNILPFRKGMIAGAAALAIAVDRVDATAAGGVQDKVDVAAATAGRMGAICRPPNTLRRRIPGRKNPNLTKLLQRISSL
jgi:hypothetical protein